MKKKKVIFVVCLFLIFVFSSCGQKEPNPKPIPDIEQNKNDTNFTADKALEEIYTISPHLKSNEYEFILDKETFELNDCEYYRYEVKENGKELEPVILVDQETKEVLTYYPEGAVYDINSDPLLGSRQLNWNGHYIRQNSNSSDYATIDLGMSDQNSFEFTLIAEKDGKKGEITSQVAIIDSTDFSKAEFDNQDGFQLVFSLQDGNLQISSKGLNIYSDSEVTFDGIYQMEPATVE